MAWSHDSDEYRLLLGGSKNMPDEKSHGVMRFLRSGNS